MMLYGVLVGNSNVKKPAHYANVATIITSKQKLCNFKPKISLNFLKSNKLEPRWRKCFLEKKWESVMLVMGAFFDVLTKNLRQQHH